MAVYLVTGASDGIGRALATALAQTGARVVMHGRNPDKLAAAAAEVRAVSGNDGIATVLADLASLQAVAGMADEVAQRFPELNVLVNNAGHLTDRRQESADGFELTFAVNYLAPYLLTRKLLPSLEANAPARIVNVASTAMGGGRVDFANLQLERGFDGWQAYANSKLMNILFSNVLAERIDGTGVVSNSLCPGLIDTNFFHTNNLFADRYASMQNFMRTPEEGALVPLYLATNSAAAAVSGKFFVREGRDDRRAVALDWDRALAEELWRVSEDWVADWL